MFVGKIAVVLLKCNLVALITYICPALQWLEWTPSCCKQDMFLYVWTTVSPLAQMVKEPACNAGDPGSIPGSGRFPGEGNGNPLHYSCLENPMDWGACWATVHGVSELDTTEWQILVLSSKPRHHLFLSSQASLGWWGRWTPWGHAGYRFCHPLGTVLLQRSIPVMNVSAVQPPQRGKNHGPGKQDVLC